MSSTFSFPSPIGGVPFNLDFAPSIIFSIAYAVAVVGSFYRLIRSASRTLTVLGTLAFVIERVVIYALRARQAHTPSEDTSHNLTIYWQMTYAIGYLSMYADLCTIMRTLFVKTTQASHTSETLLANDTSASTSNADLTGYSSPADEDRPRERFLYRRIFGIGMILCWVPIIMGIVAGYDYPSAETNAGKASTVQALRYATTGISFVLIANLQVLALYGYLTIPRIRKSSALIAFGIASLLNVISIYRLVVMRCQTHSLTSVAPGSLNQPADKAAFYVFQAAPELLASAVMLTVNVRERFVTGMFGDRSRDPKPKTDVEV